MTRTKPLSWTLGVLAVLLAGTLAQAQNTPTLATPDKPAETAPMPDAAAASVAAQPAVASDASPKPETVVERYPNGRPKVERQVIQDSAGNYVNHGTYTQYDLDGQAIKTGEYRNGKQVGKWTQRFAKDEGYLFSSGQDKDFVGPFTTEATFDDGQLHGAWTIKDHNGQSIIEWNFDHGVRNGVSTWWYSSGEKRLEAPYKNGTLNGEMVETARDGKILSRATYIDGRYLAKTTEWYAPGQKHFEGDVLRAQTTPEPTYDWWTLSAKQAGPVAATPDQKHGVWTVWYRNGNKKIEGQYDHGVLTAKCAWWYENGQQQAEGEYTNGLKTGTWTTWHTNGLKESEGQYKDGNLVSKFLRWSADGKLAEIHDFNTLKPQEAPQPQINVGQRNVRGYRTR
jgi:antitoxin component YwqK of YwqJK toxin-antitoxin module